MSFLDKVFSFLPLRKKEEEEEYFFATNIGTDKLTAALWVIGGQNLKVLEVASESYSGNDEIVGITDRLLDTVVGLKEIEPQKILFGVPDSWVSDDNLKDEYLNILRNLVKELELTPMAYVATGNALIHFLEHQEGVPTTAILVGFEKKHLTITVVRAGKLDGVKVVSRGSNCGSDIEKALLTFTDVETLPSKILIYGLQAQELKSHLLSFPWMTQLSFLHFPKIEVMEEDLEIKSVCLAGGSEIKGSIKFSEGPARKPQVASVLTTDESKAEESVDKEAAAEGKPEDMENFGFVTGDVSAQNDLIAEEQSDAGESALEIEDFEQEITPPSEPPQTERRKKLNLKNSAVLAGITGALVLLVGAYAFLPKAEVKIYVEPMILEKDAQVAADPKQKEVNEDAKIIPGQIVEAEVSGSAKDTATGKKQIGDLAKGTVVIINNTDQGQSFLTGTILTTSGGLKFKLNNTASVSATLSDATSKSTKTAEVTAVEIGADGNITSETTLKIGNYPTSQFVAKTQGNFSGGTSKDVTVVSGEDAQRLLAKLSSDLRQQAQQKLQEKYPDKKILVEALSENTRKKSYSKNINDQAAEFSLSMTALYKGTAFEDKDLKLIVSKLVTTQVPDGFTLDLAETETQAAVSKLEKDGKLVFSAKFKAKLLPKIDTEKVKSQIKFKTPAGAANILKGMDNVLGSEIKITPGLPELLQRLPLLGKNIKVEAGLK